jgi:hypothetical protein
MEYWNDGSVVSGVIGKQTPIVMIIHTQLARYTGADCFETHYSNFPSFHYSIHQGITSV